VLIASVQDALTDADLILLRDRLLDHVGRFRSHGVVIDVTALDVLDSFSCRMLREIVEMMRLKGATTVVAGIQPEVAFAMVQLGLTLGETATVLDLEEALVALKTGARAWNANAR
jgi:rsbT antagonist protein RsbS